MAYVYFGSDPFSRAVLEGLAERVEPLAVVTQPDRPSGRKQKIQPGPLSSLAAQRGWDLIQPESLKVPEHQEQILGLGADLMIVVSFGQIIPRAFIDRAPDLINGHASLLPEYRGASPIQSVILDGKVETGMTIMRIVPALDAGPMIRSEEVKIGRMNHGELCQALIASAIRLLLPFAEGAKVPPGEEQDHEKSTHCGKLTKAQAELHPKAMSADEMDRIVRAFSPAPGAFLHLQTGKGPKRLKVLKAEPFEGSGGKGSLSKSDSSVILWGCDGNGLELHQVQFEGKGAMAVEAFLNGFQEELVLA